MGAYLARRVLVLVPLLFGVTAITFAILVLAPGDPVDFLISPEERGITDVSVLRHQLGLDRPLPVQYASMMAELATGRLRSFSDRRPTIQRVGDALPTTLILTATSLAATLALAIPIAVVSATRPYSAVDHAATLFSLLGISLPTFWLALALIYVFTERLGLLPASGLRPVGFAGYAPGIIWPYLIMPTAVQALSILPVLVRYARSSLLDAFGQDYVRVARRRVWRAGRPRAPRRAQFADPGADDHGAPPAVSPQRFGRGRDDLRPAGAGRLAVGAALARDYPTVLTTTTIAGALVVLSNLGADLGYYLLDPRIRDG